MTLPLLLAVACGLAWSAHDALRKLLVAEIRPLALLVLLAGGSAPPFAVWLLLDPAQRTVSPSYLLPALASVTLNVFANLALLRGVRLAPLSLAVPLLSLTPAFATLAAIPLLNERPSILDSIGILLVVAGAIWLGKGTSSPPTPPVSEATAQAARSSSAPRPSADAQRAASSTPDDSLRRRRQHRKGALWMIATALGWSLTPALDKLALESSSPAFHAFVLTAGVALVVLALLAARGRLRELAGVARVPGVFVLAVVSSTLALGLQLLAFRWLWVGLVETLKRGIGNVMALALGRLVFGERAGWTAFAAVLAMAAGVALILGSP